jgi:hypothetical protein
MKLFNETSVEQVTSTIAAELAAGNIVTRKSIVDLLSLGETEEQKMAAELAVGAMFKFGLIPNFEMKKRIGIRPVGEEPKKAPKKASKKASKEAPKEVKKASRRGRPKGSKNKPKGVKLDSVDSAVEAPVKALVPVEALSLKEEKKCSELEIQSMVQELIDESWDNSIN